MYWIIQIKSSKWQMELVVVQQNREKIKCTLFIWSFFDHICKIVDRFWRTNALLSSVSNLIKETSAGCFHGNFKATWSWNLLSPKSHKQKSQKSVVWFKWDAWRWNPKHSGKCKMWQERRNIEERRFIRERKSSGIHFIWIWLQNRYYNVRVNVQSTHLYFLKLSWTHHSKV